MLDNQSVCMQWKIRDANQIYLKQIESLNLSTTSAVAEWN